MHPDITVYRGRIIEYSAMYISKLRAGRPAVIAAMIAAAREGAVRAVCRGLPR